MRVIVTGKEGALLNSYGEACRHAARLPKEFMEGVDDPPALEREP